MNSALWLTYRFINLPYHTRLEIARQLDLIRDDDEDSEGTELSKTFLLRAHEKRILDKLSDAVESRYREI